MIKDRPEYIKVIDRENIKGIFSTKVGWNKTNIETNLEEIFKIDKNRIVSLKQIHGNKVYLLESKISGLEGDGLVTKEKQLLLTSSHADCTPIYFYDEKNEVIGLAHSGWKGTYLSIAKEVVKVFLKENSKLEDIKVVIGPYISGDCYEVKSDVYSLFEENYKEALKEKAGKVYLDMGKVIVKDLESIGILKGNIHVLNRCTFTEDTTFNSYRRDGKNYRNMVGAIIQY